MKNKKSEDQLIRFVWSRKVEYECELKMKVTHRSCCERVSFLLKKHRMEEGQIIRSTGAADDKITELKKLLIIVNEMALTKPNKTNASIHLKKNKEDGETIRNAALLEISDSDSDDYIHGNSSRNDSSKKLPNDEMSLQEEILMGEQMYRDRQSKSCKDGPSTSSENQYSIPEPDLASESCKDGPTTSSDNQYSIPEPDLASQRMNVDDDDRGMVRETERTPVTKGSSVSTSSIQKDKTSTSKEQSANNRFSNPKKDLINFLERKSNKDMSVRREEIRIREIEAQNKKEELEILRLRTEAEADNKKEELQILRIRTEAEAEERKRTQDFLMTLINKNN